MLNTSWVAATAADPRVSTHHLDVETARERG
ncbi:hypothetical protein ThidrDRAFT_0619 [Thiorhodococcus drewsii AZ1]|uniref:Uncharacterized protein n=1 Tax=Thiorhodococcus drewsii AZ1 TaxID=765913 RepID=G2DX58_9GAMM|nr:hypothetical protein ThidrDRAFT_0619 [Thiorhodococcus drewsii AZ1]